MIFNKTYIKHLFLSFDLMWRYYHLLLRKTEQEIKDLQAAVTACTVHPMKLKKELAHGIIVRFWSSAEADAAQQIFEELFQKKDYSHAQEVQLDPNLSNPLWVVELLKALKAAPSSSEARRLIEAGAVSLNEVKVTDLQLRVELVSGLLIKVGKHRIYRLK